MRINSWSVICHIIFCSLSLSTDTVLIGPDSFLVLISIPTLTPQLTLSFSILRANPPASLQISRKPASCHHTVIVRGERSWKYKQLTFMVLFFFYYAGMIKRKQCSCQMSNGAGKYCCSWLKSWYLLIHFKGTVHINENM